MWYKDAESFKKAAGHEVGSVWYPRVTKILDVKAKPALDIFFKEMGSYKAAEEVKMKSAEEGTKVHEIVQALAVGKDIEITDKTKPVAEAFSEFNKTANIVFHPEFIERPIWSQLHRYSGTIDALATVGGKFGVLDIKTSTGFYPEYNLQTAAYVLALQENDVKKALELPGEIQTRWILRVDQQRTCLRCGSTLREKGGRSKVRPVKISIDINRYQSISDCNNAHYWGPTKGIVELREFPYYIRDIKAFLAAKILWEWENDYWLRRIGYLR